LGKLYLHIKNKNMNVNIIEFQSLQHELQELKDRVEIFETHMKGVEKDDLEMHKCPFCGSGVYVASMIGGYAVFCHNTSCYMYGGFGHRTYPSLSSAVENWNDAFLVENETPSIASKCPSCVGDARTIPVPTEGGVYYRTMCGNRRCPLENVPDAPIFRSKNASIDFWNEFVDKWSK
jgi:hypothetical protein